MLDCFATSSSIDQAFISIFDETQCYFYIPASFRTDGDTLKIWMYDEANRLEIDFCFDKDMQLLGTCTQYGKSATGIFTKTSENPKYNSPSPLLKNATVLLRENNDFTRDDTTSVKFEYDYDDPKLTELRNKYNLEEIAGTGDTQEKAIKLLNWLCSGTHHNGYYSHEYINALDLLEYAYNQGSTKGLNCKNLSILLSEMYLSVGIQSRALWLFPETDDGDNHVVVMVWIPENNKWIMLDPSFNSYFADSEGNILSPMEIRESLMSGKQMQLNED